MKEQKKATVAKKAALPVSIDSGKAKTKLTKKAAHDPVAPVASKKKDAVKSSTPVIPPPPAQVAVWQVDPGSGWQPVLQAVPRLTAGALPLQIQGEPPPEAPHQPGTWAFRYWNCADTLCRARDLWATYVPELLQWQKGDALEVQIDQSRDLNAYYDRQSLSFHQGLVQGQSVHTADSPDIVAHEVGHAVLDALRPDLWDAALDEVAAFHESFADITALLTALHSPTVAALVVRETGGYLYQDSVVSRFAAQFGQAVHAINPASAPPDCLRNAVNAFFYREPLHLPPVAPHHELSAEPHSFSRVFTAAFLEALAGMLKTRTEQPQAEDVIAIASDAATLLGRAVRSAALSAAFFSELAAQLILADLSLWNGKYGDALRSAFVRRGLLSLESIRTVRLDTPRANTGSKAQATDEMPRGRDMILRAHAYGLMEGVLVVRTASFSRRGTIASAALGAGSTPVPGVEQATQSFLETLFRRGRVDFSGCKVGLSAVPHLRVRRKTHYLIEQNGQYHLRRRCFDESTAWE